MASQFPGGSPVTPPPPPAGGGFVGRVQRIITQPATEWQRIAAEPASAQGIFMSYSVPLAAIGPIAGLIGSQLFSFGPFHVHLPIVTSLIMAVIQYAGALAGVWLLAFIIDLLAPTFGSTKDLAQSMKVSAYSLTAVQVAGIFNILPLLGILVFVGLIYGFYLFWVGLPIVKRPPADKAVGYAVVTIIVDIVAYFIIAAIITAITATVILSSAGALTAPGTTVITTGS